MGRFITEDPIGFKGGLNLNVSFENNPVGNTDPYGEQVPYSYNKEIWFWGVMQAGNKYVKRVSHYADTETTGPIWDVIKWTLQGIYSKKTGCCLSSFAKCMGIPDFSQPTSVASGVLTYWQILGWQYPAYVQDFKYLGKTAVLFDWKWILKRLRKTISKTLGGIGLAATIYEYGRCWWEMKKCMGW